MNIFAVRGRSAWILFTVSHEYSFRVVGEEGGGTKEVFHLRHSDSGGLSLQAVRPRAMVRRLGVGVVV